MGKEYKLSSAQIEIIKDRLLPHILREIEDEFNAGVEVGRKLEREEITNKHRTKVEL